jgi:hypothetical protein
MAFIMAHPQERADSDGIDFCYHNAFRKISTEKNAEDTTRL